MSDAIEFITLVSSAISPRTNVSFVHVIFYLIRYQNEKPTNIKRQLSANFF